MTTDTAPAELVTEEMIEKAVSVYVHENRFGGYIPAYMLARVLRAVAPLIAARSEERTQYLRASAVRRADEHARAEEREAIARFASQWMDDKGIWPSYAEGLAAAIRARGTPRTAFSPIVDKALAARGEEPD